jgi:hypothetical protein
MIRTRSSDMADKQEQPRRKREFMMMIQFSQNYLKASLRSGVVGYPPSVVEYRIHWEVVPRAKNSRVCSFILTNKRTTCIVQGIGKCLLTHTRPCLLWRSLSCFDVLAWNLLLKAEEDTLVSAWLTVATGPIVLWPAPCIVGAARRLTQVSYVAALRESSVLWQQSWGGLCCGSRSDCDV